MAFIGRKEELKQLNMLFKKNTASLVVVKGRRRIGKSRLIVTTQVVIFQDGAIQVI